MYVFGKDIKINKAEIWEVMWIFTTDFSDLPLHNKTYVNMTSK